MIIVATMAIIAAGQLFVITDLVSPHFGIPQWIWIHLTILTVLLALAWLATGFITADGES